MRSVLRRSVVFRFGILMGVLESISDSSVKSDNLLTLNVLMDTHTISQKFYIWRQNHEKRHNSARRWWMFLLFDSTSDVEQIGLELSREKSVQCRLLSPYSSRKTVPQRQFRDSEAGRSWFGF